MIPKRVTIAGIDIDIVWAEIGEGARCLGKADYVAQKIYLNPNLAQQDTLNQCYYHELLHYIFFVMGKTNLKDDEGFIDGLAHLLYQARKSEVKREEE